MAMTQQEVIKKFMTALDNTTLSGSKAVDEAIRACSSFIDTKAVIDQMLADQKKAGSSDKFLKNYCGIILGNEDTGAITGSDAGGSKVKTSTNVVPNGKFDTNFEETSFTKRGVKFQLAAGLASTPLNDFDALTAEQQHVWQGLYSFWAEESLKLIEESYGYSLTDSDSRFSEIRVFFVNDSSASRYTAKTFNKVYENSNEKYIYLSINMFYFNNIDPKNLDGKYPYWDDYYLDRLIAHELTHAVMNAKINSFASLPAIILEGTAELTAGMDDSQDINIKKAAANQNMLKDLLVLKTDYNKVDGINNEDYVAGYMFLRYLAKQASTNYPLVEIIENKTKNKTVNGTSANDTIKNYAGGVKIYAGGGNDSIYNSTDKKYTINSSWGYVTIDGGAGNDFIESEDPNVSIFGGAGNDTVIIHSSTRYVTVRGGDDNDSIDSNGIGAKLFGDNGNDFIRNTNLGSSATIYGGAGNDTIRNSGKGSKIFGDAGNDSILNFHDEVTISGGAGNDIISLASDANNVVVVYSAGDGSDVIYGLTAEDTLSLTGSSNFTTVTSGNNLVVRNNGTNAVTIQGGKGKSLNVVGLTTTPSVITNDKNSVVVNGTSANDTIKNTGATVKVYGGNGNDSLYNSANYVTLSGGAGNDKITNFYSSNGGNYVSMAGDAGKDYIYDNYGWYVTLSGGADNDTLVTYRGKNNQLLGGAGNDIISLSSSEGISTINAGAGNDIIYSNGDSLYGHVYQYSSGDGNDIIYGFTSKDTLKISGTSSTLKSGSDTVIKIGSGSITLKNYKTIIPNPSKTITNYTKNKTINGGGFNDTITNYAGGVKIYGGFGNDSIYNSVNTNYTVKSSFGYVTIDGGIGNDVIRSFDPYVSISGGDGNDSINHGGASFRGVTINGGAGNDTIISNSTVGAVFQFASVDGSDVVYGFTAKDTIQTHSSMKYHLDSSTSDTKVTIGSAKITLKNFKGVPKVVGGLSSNNIFGGLSNKISGTSSLWIDDNFIGENNLDAITDKKYSVTQIQTEENSVAQADNLSIVAYSEK